MASSLQPKPVLTGPKLSDYVNRWRNLLFPPACVFCHAPVTGRKGCCARCAADIRIWPHKHCLHCGRVLPEHLAPGPCGRCLQRAPPQDRTENLFIYQEGPVRSAILDWKLQGRDAGMLWLLDTAGAHLQTLFGPQSLLLPVPMPLSRMRRSGHHHAADLCRAIGRQTDARVDWRVLRRSGMQQRQSALSGKARWKNLCNAFRTDSDHWAEITVGQAANRVPDMEVWVVDDIMTTGATMHYACRSLHRAGIRTSAFSLTRLANRD